MNNTEEVFVKVKPCFGLYENFNSSWHCKGCIFKDECETKAKEIENEQCEA